MVVDGKEVAAVEYQLVVTAEGSIELELTDEFPLLKEALRDCIGAHPCRGAGSSMYWVDRAVKYLEQRLEDGGKEPLASGKATYLQVRDGLVEARYEFALDDEVFDAVPAGELLSALRTLRQRMAELTPRATRPTHQQIPLL
jgi:hypothetical protein